MLDKAKTLLGYKLSGGEGEIGTVKEFYFDDHHWAVRYLVADTGSWLPGRQVLISPYALEGVSRERHRLVLGLTKREIEDEPALDHTQPVSRGYEDAYHRFHGWPAYWTGPYAWGCSPSLDRDRRHWGDAMTTAGTPERPLRTTGEVCGSYIQTIDGEMGHVEDVIIDHDAWVIRYLVIDARYWWPGKRVLMSPQWIRRAHWDRRELFVALSNDAIREAPEYTDHLLMTRDYESRLHQHYGRRGYWLGDAEPTDQIQ